MLDPFRIVSPLSQSDSTISPSSFSRFEEMSLNELFRGTKTFSLFSNSLTAPSSFSTLGSDWLIDSDWCLMTSPLYSTKFGTLYSNSLQFTTSTSSSLNTVCLCAFAITLCSKSDLILASGSISDWLFDCSVKWEISVLSKLL